jgi:hypothetical protein
VPSHLTLTHAGSAIGIHLDTEDASYPITVDPLVQQAEIADPAGVAKDLFGNAIATTSSTIVIAQESDGTIGAAYVYTEPAAGWAAIKQPTAKLSTGATNDDFGASVAIDQSGDTIAVGASHTSGDAGAEYVFTRPPGGWISSSTPAATLTQTAPGAIDFLGSASRISPDGDTIFASAPDRTVSAKSFAGAVYVWTKPTSGWKSTTQQATITGSSPAASQTFGESLALSSDAGTLAVGASGETPTHGTVFVVDKPAAGWTGTIHPGPELTASDGASGDQLGASVAIAGNAIVAGAPDHKNGAAGNAGAVYVFVEPAGGWMDATQTAELTESSPLASAYLGTSVLLSSDGDTVYAGAPSNYAPSNHPGVVDEFDAPAAGWAALPSHLGHESRQLSAGNAFNGEAFGMSLGSIGSTLFVGAPYGDTTPSPGWAYVFGLPTPTISVTAPLSGHAYTQGSALKAGYSCAVTGATISSCSGSTANGAAISTATLGTHIFTVTATTSDGVEASDTVSFTVVPPMPSVSSFSESHKTWRLGSKLAKESRARHRKPPVGTKFTFKLNVPARVTLMFKPHHGKASSLMFSAKAGARKLSFDGRIAKKKKLKPGRYKVTITASANGKRSAPRSLSFTITD